MGGEEKGAGFLLRGKVLGINAWKSATLKGIYYIEY